MRRWKKQDGKVRQHIPVHYNGMPVQMLRRSFASACEEARLGRVSPHILRHTRATWLTGKGIAPWEASGHLGMSIRTPELFRL
jgi:integrase